MMNRRVIAGLVPAISIKEPPRKVDRDATSAGMMESKDVRPYSPVLAARFAPEFCLFVFPPLRFGGFGPVFWTFSAPLPNETRGGGTPTDAPT
jgi:hypothetical protein